MKAQKEITRAAGIYTLGTLLSRVLGFLREVAIAYFLGTGMAADAFFVAFRLPNLWRRLFAEGSMVIVFVPVFTEYLTVKSKEEALRLARIVWTLLATVLIILSILGILLAPWLIKLIAPGFEKIPQKFCLTVTLTRIMFPYVVLICLAALAIAMLNSLRYFAAPAFSYSLLNISMIGSLVMAHYFHWTPVYALAAGVLIGGLGQLGLQLPFLIKEGFSLRPLFCFHHPALKRIFKLMLPAVLGAAVYQVSIFINTILASFLPQGSVAYLYYADRLVQFPLALFAFSLGTASLPALSEQAATKDLEIFKETFSFGLKTTLFFIIPATFGLILLRKPMLKVFFERGAFKAASTQATAQALLCYALGLPFFSSLRFLNNAFYALQDTKTPVKVNAFCLLFNVPLGILLMIPLKHAGLALTTSIIALVNVAILSILLKKRIGQVLKRDFWSELFKAFIASLFMVVIIKIINIICPKTAWQLLLSLVLGGTSFLMTAYVLHCSSISVIKKSVINHFLK